MSRKGMNPLRRARVETPPAIVAAVITHLPNETGYHAQRLEVIQASLLSLRQHAGRPIHVAVWDNGSGDALRNWLINEYKPDTLIMGHNLGKSFAQNALMHMFPKLTIISYADDDMLYYPGWLESQLEILDAYPECIVSGYPTRSQSRYAIDRTVAWSKEHAKTVDAGVTMPHEWLMDYLDSVGMSKATHSLEAGSQIIIEYKGVRAYIGTHHCQYMAYIDTVLPYVGVSRQDENNRPEGASFDKPTNEAGILRLSTTDRYTRHIGNILDGSARTDAILFGVATDEAELNYA